MFLLAAQGSAAVLQFGYAALVSRLVGRTGFGEYAVALAAVAIIQLLSVGGVSQAVARAKSIETAVSRSLARSALISGVLGAALTIGLAPAWAHLWGIPGAASLVRWMALGVVAAPSAGLCNGLLRRDLRFRQLAGINFSASALGLIVGAAVVYIFRSPQALVANIVAVPILTWAASLIVLGRRAIPAGRHADAAPHLKFGRRVLLSSMTAYASANIPRICYGNVAGAGGLGSLNRSETVSQVPLQYLQNSLLQSLYPKFDLRTQDGEDTGPRTETIRDGISLCAWVSIFVTLTGIAVVPVALPVLLGPTWVSDIPLALGLLLAYGTAITPTLFEYSLEASGLFRPVWLTEIIVLCLQVCAAVAIGVTGSVVPLVASIVGANMVRYTVWRLASRRYSILNASDLVAGNSTAHAFGLMSLGFWIGAYWICRDIIHMATASAYKASGGLLIGLVVSGFLLAFGGMSSMRSTLVRRGLLSAGFLPSRLSGRHRRQGQDL